MSDPSGAVWTLLQCMDGRRDAEAIIEQVLERHPAETSASVRHALDALIQAGFVDDAAATAPPGLTDREQERYDRSRVYLRWVDRTPRANTWEPQKRLKGARVTVIGLGGTGSCAALALARSGVGQLHCVDGDVVELSNLNRQILYTEADIGKPKVDVAVEKLRAANSDITVTGQRMIISGSEDIMPLAEASDVLLLAADEPQEIRLWTNRACLATKTPWVGGGYLGPVMAVGVYVPGRRGCWECLHEAQHQEQREMGVEFEEVDRQRAAREHGVIAPSAGIAGYLAANAVMSLITGVPESVPGRIHVLNLIALDNSLVIDHPRRTDCASCGESAEAVVTADVPR